MANSNFWLMAFSLIAHHVLTSNAHDKHPIVPSMYIFGDSIADAGNNNHLDAAIAKANWPYGIDFQNKTGRFTNGRNGADFLAEYLHLPLPQPYLSLSAFERSQATTVINYASGGCGILNTTRAGGCLSLSQQVEYFTITATKDLPKTFKKEKKKLSQHLAESIYLLFIGSNDYIPQVNQNITNKYSPQDFADLVIDELTKHIKTFYDLGARKFMVMGLATCERSQYTTPSCYSRYYNEKLPQRLKDLQKKLPSLLYTIFDAFSIYTKMFENAEKYGITNVKVPCYVRGQPICPDRSKYNQFDMPGHQTEISFEIASKECFYGSGCTPLSLLKLAEERIPEHVK